MAKSDDFPGQKRNPTSQVSGMRPPAEMAQPNLKVSVADMLAMQNADSAENSPVATAPMEGEFIPRGQGVIEQVRVDKIRRSPYQPRLRFDEASIEDLANSIASVGLAKPITLRLLANGEYELIGGERRWRAHKFLGRETITAWVLHSVTDEMAEILAITDNEGQEALTEYERGKSYSRIMSSGRETSIRGLARSVGVNHSIVSRCLLLMDLPAEVRTILDDEPGLIGGKWAKDFIEFSRSDPALLMQAVTSMRDDQWTQEHALRWIAKELLDRSQKPQKSRFTEVEISGIGKVRVDGKKIELRCEKSVDAQRLANQFEKFLKNLNRDDIASK